MFVCRLVAKPCSHLLQIQAEGPRQAQPNDVLEKVYRSKTVLDAPLLASDTLPVRRATIVNAICYLSSLVSRQQTTGGALQAAGLGGAENTEMVPHPSEPGQA